MKIIYNKYLPIKGYVAINLFGVVFARHKYNPLSSSMIRHEAIHTAQMRELLFIFFYLWYVIEWLVRLVQYRNANAAYYNISFEREAYANDHTPGYLKQRKPYNFIHHLRETKKPQ